ncbi:hypothetical protein Hypma_013856 [Hypsizygus marmoreus]|uniref:Uncharacterized protein n=1 Tax=Hypsizygus marmoreus TaxID=39966 RepID=A0A369KAA3_HYPMA|nr:hypothetical protein Hypma_013856 [Hypsizygus marmoreus]
MGHPRIHHMAEERRAANQAKSRRSYERNKVSIKAKRSVGHREKDHGGVSVGRPHIHHTTEEQAAAKRAKSRWHYESNKSTVRMKRSVSHRENVKSNEFMLPVSTGVECPEVVHSKPAPSHESDPLGYWCYRVERVAIKLDTRTGAALTTFLDGICSSYLTNRNKDTIRDTLLIFTPLQKSIYRYMDEILDIAGLCDEYKRAEVVSRSVLQVIQSVEDILCKAMLGYDDLLTAFEQRELYYQIMNEV